MAVLTEALMFSNSALDLFKKVYDKLSETNSSLDELDMSFLSDDELDSFSAHYNRLKDKCYADKSAVNDTLLLRYACDGPSTIHNPKLYYLTQIGNNIWKESQKILLVNELASKNKCHYISTITNKFNSWLCIDNLYTRDERDFTYSVIVLDALTNTEKLQNYFPFAKSKDGKKYYVPLDLDEDDIKLFPEWAIFKQNTNKPYRYYLIDYRLFLEGDADSIHDARLIPAGVNSTSGRNMWHYIQLFSDPISDEDIAEYKATHNKKNDPIQQAVDSDLDDADSTEEEEIKDLINFSRMSDDVRSRILQYIDKHS